ncbi:MAG TPA: GlsB/YeaQ/YmgE family stress response membrane protein [Blastocatellia bacterium]|nr:GlsB/YeaQ/YmgE family stress response membrane protein [Blastocatellia bacterium]
MFELIGWVVFGLIIGVLAKLIMPGKDPGGIFVTAIIGMVGSLLGTLVGRYIFARGEYYRAGWIMSILGAVVLLAIYRMIAARRA